MYDSCDDTSDYDSDASSDSYDVEPLTVLGFGLPIKDSQEKWKLEREAADGEPHRFPNAVADWGARPLIVRERNMITLMGELTDKSRWDRKIFDAEIVSKWRAEAVKGDEQFSDTMFDYVSFR